MSDRWPALLTLEEACEYLGVGKTKFGELRSLRYVESVRMGSDKLIRFRRSDLDRFVEGLPTGKGQVPIKASMARLMG